MDAGTSTPPSTTSSLLSWQPIFAAVSLAGDLGYTTGPWEFKKDIKDAKPSAFGNFMTVWRKQADGNWKFALDLGISNPEPKTTTPRWQPDNIQPGTGSFKRIDPEAARTALLNVDRDFSKASADQGPREAFLLYAAKDVRLFRSDHFPFVGKMAAADALVPITAEWTWTPSFAASRCRVIWAIAMASTSCATKVGPVQFPKGETMRGFGRRLTASGSW